MIFLNFLDDKKYRPDPNIHKNYRYTLVIPISHISEQALIDLAVSLGGKWEDKLSRKLYFLKMFKAELTFK